MSCGIGRERVAALLDGELPPGEVAEVEGHVRGCPSCAAEYGRIRSLQAALRGGSLAFAPPPGLSTRVRAAVARGPRGRAVTRLRPLFLMAASVVLGVGIGRLLPSGGRNAAGTPLDALVDTHVRALASGKLTEVASSDQHTVKPWFGGRVPFSPDVKDLAAEGFPLLGGRVENVSGAPTAVLVYGRALHVIEVFVHLAGRGTERTGATEVRGFHVVTWRQGDLDYDAVSDLNGAELSGFASRLRR